MYTSLSSFIWAPRTLVEQFFIVGSCTAFSLAAIKTNMDTDYWSKKISSMSSVWSSRNPSSDEMVRTQQFDLGSVSLPSISSPVRIFCFAADTQFLRQLICVKQETTKLCWKNQRRHNRLSWDHQELYLRHICERRTVIPQC